MALAKAHRLRVLSDDWSLAKVFIQWMETWSRPWPKWKRNGCWRLNDSGQGVPSVGGVMEQTLAKVMGE